MGNDANYFSRDEGISMLLFFFSSLTLLLLSGGFMRIAPLAASLLVSGCLLAVGAIVWRQLAQGTLPRKYFWPFFLICLALFLSLFDPQTKPIVAQGYALAFIAILLSFPLGSSAHVHRCSPVLWTLFAFFVFSLSVEILPGVWWITDEYCREVSSKLGSFFQVACRLGPTAMGLSGLLCCLIYTWIRIVPALRKHWRRGITVTLALIALNHIGAIFFVWLGHVLTLERTAGISWSNWGKIGERGVTALTFAPVLFLLECICLYLFIGRSVAVDSARGDDGGILKRKGTLISTSVLWFFLAGVAFVAPQRPAGDYKGRITLYEGGLTGWQKPNFQQLGGSNMPGLFCVLPDYLRSFGFDVQVTKEISETVLSDSDVFVIININEDLGNSVRDALNDYVKNGGALMLFADHTDMSGLMKWSNDLLSETPIRVNFDSAHFLNRYWKDAFKTRLHPINRRNWDKDGIGISVGASLKLLDHRANPILIARYGFSDAGNYNDAVSGYLGDRIYRVKEPLGDIVLAAVAPLGQGKVIVFGDTALLQLGSLVYCQQYIADLFRWAVHGRVSLFPWGILLVFALIATGWMARYRHWHPLAPIPIMLSAVLAISIGEYILGSTYGNHDYNERFAYLDHAHVSLTVHQGYSEDNGDYYLADNLVRNGYLPVAQKKFDETVLQKASLMISAAATKPFSKKESRLIDKFVKDGGQVFIASSDRTRHATEKFLKSYGIEILDIPLGSIQPENNSDKIVTYHTNPVLATGSGGERVLLNAFDNRYVVALEKDIGKGKLTVIGDYGILFSAVLEKQDWASPENIFFLKKLIGRQER
jgi:hypothetical protein